MQNLKFCHQPCQHTEAHASAAVIVHSGTGPCGNRAPVTPLTSHPFHYIHTHMRLNLLPPSYAAFRVTL